MIHTSNLLRYERRTQVSFIRDSDGILALTQMDKFVDAIASVLVGRSEYDTVTTGRDWGTTSIRWESRQASISPDESDAM